MWNYRVVKTTHKIGEEIIDSYGIHEAYYDNDIITSVTESPINIYSEEGMEGLRKEFEGLRKALECPVIDYDTLKEIE